MYSPESEPDVCKLILQKRRENILAVCGQDHVGEVISDAVRMCSEANGSSHECELALRLIMKWFKKGQGVAGA